MAGPRDRTKPVYFIFFISGMSALIYETVWLRMLIRTLGSTVYATSTVLGAFMAGLALGSYLFGGYADRAKHLLRLYGLLEAGIAVIALAIPFIFSIFVPIFQAIYAHTGGASLTVLRAVIVFIILVVPASLMGGTLPVLSGYLAREKSTFGRRMGSLYGINTFGAVLGVVSTGFVLIGFIGEFNTILIGVAGNLCAAAIALILSRGQETPSEQPATPAPDETAPAEKAISPYSARIRLIVAIVFAASGFVALSYEVVWTRILQLFLRTSIYSFSAMLSTYLTGIALGSMVGRSFVDRIKDPIYLFAALEIIIAFLAVLGLNLLVPMDSTFFRNTFGIFGKLIATGIIVFPITFCLGMVFPVVAKCFARSEGSVGSSIGRIYSLNTVGCILGSLICGFLLMPLLGSATTVLVLAGVNILLGLILFLSDPARLRHPATVAIIVIGALATIVGGIVVRDPFYQIVENRISEQLGGEYEIYLHRENVTATITAFGSTENPRKKRLWLNGVGMTILVSETKLMAHLPFLLAADPKDMLIICFGMGTTLRSAVVHDDLRVDTVELVPDTYDAYGFYHPDGPEILEYPRVHHYVDDGRNFLLMHDKKYDVITIDPAPPIYSAGTVNLYAREFISLCRDHLTPGGVLCLWVPPCPETEARMIMSTFHNVFPHGTVWRGVQFAGFYLIGTTRPLSIPEQKFRDAFEDAKFRADVLEWDNDIDSAETLEGLLLLDEKELVQFVKGVPIITDDHPYTEFPIWRMLTNERARKTYTANDLEKWKESHPLEKE